MNDKVKEEYSFMDIASVVQDPYGWKISTLTESHSI